MKTLPSAGDVCTGVARAFGGGLDVGFDQCCGPNVALVIVYPYGVNIVSLLPDGRGVDVASDAPAEPFGAAVGITVGVDAGCGVGVAGDPKVWAPVQAVHPETRIAIINRQTIGIYF